LLVARLAVFCVNAAASGGISTIASLSALAWSPLRMASTIGWIALFNSALRASATAFDSAASSSEAGSAW
jgi:hypothetical protein